MVAGSRGGSGDRSGGGSGEAIVGDRVPFFVLAPEIGGGFAGAGEIVGGGIGVSGDGEVGARGSGRRAAAAGAAERGGDDGGVTEVRARGRGTEERGVRRGVRFVFGRRKEGAAGHEEEEEGLREWKLDWRIRVFIGGGRGDCVTVTG